MLFQTLSPIRLVIIQLGSVITWLNTILSLHWCHNERDDISNHQPHHCLLNRILRCRSKKTSKLCVTGLNAGNSPVTGEFLHKWPVTRKMFPFDDVIMLMLARLPMLVHFDLASRKLTWARGIFYRTYKGHQFIDECTRYLVSHTLMGV